MDTHTNEIIARREAYNGPDMVHANLTQIERHVVSLLADTTSEPVFNLVYCRRFNKYPTFTPGGNEMPTSMRVKLNHTEQAVAKVMAADRMETCEPGNISGNLRQNVLDGAAAEVAFCKLQNIYPDIDARVKKVDCTLPDGTRVDVKNTVYQHGRLYVAKTKEHDRGAVDMYVQMIGTLPNFEFVGWLKYAELVMPERLRELAKGKTPGYCAERYELRPPFCWGQ